jgi:citrate lyase subunit beta/citryl-CoA lyase
VNPRPLGRARSVLFIPAVRPDFLAKAPRRGSDVIVVDCEDATPPNEKQAARPVARAAIHALVEAGCTTVLRVNSPGSEWCADDIELAVTAELAAVMVPKVETVRELDDLGELLGSSANAGVGIIAGLETALGVADARPLLAHRQVVGAYFGAEDFIADMGGLRTPGNDEVRTARSLVALAGRLAGVPVLDMVVSDFTDDGRYTVEAAEARALGYAGKLCIHPNQVALANQAFTPSDAEIDRARRLIEAFEEGVAAGLGVVSFEGQMIDEPLVRQARRVLTLAV